MATNAIGLRAIDHIVVLMLENRSFDHMLGYLYHESGNFSPAGQPFDGLTGTEANPGGDGAPVPAFPISPDTPNAYFMPGANPGEGYLATNGQLFGSTTAPTPPAATMQGFVIDYSKTLDSRARDGQPIVSGTQPRSIMGCFAPGALPVLSGLARGFAVCDQWFCSAPTQTLPNRAFALTGTSQGHMDDDTRSFTAPTIFSALRAAGVDWAVYGYEAPPLTRQTFAGITNEPEANFGLFTDFRQAAAAGTLPGFVFLEPSWDATGNSQHPNFDVAPGEQLIHDVYYALRNSSAWGSTLLIITYDEHGGCYDHVPPPMTATPPDSSAGEYGFDFTRFGATRAHGLGLAADPGRNGPAGPAPAAWHDQPVPSTARAGGGVHPAAHSGQTPAVRRSASAQRRERQIWVDGPLPCVLRLLAMPSKHGDLELDDDPGRVDLDALWAFLSSEAYWGRWRDREVVARQVASAWRVVAAYEPGGRMVGFARALSDGLGLAYLADVYVLPEFRGQGAGAALVGMMIEAGPGAAFRWMLHTADAHGLYRRFGFRPPDEMYLERPGRPDELARLQRED